MIGPENSRLSLLIICKIKTNHVLVARVFPRFRQSVFPRFRHSGWFYFEFSLVIKDMFIPTGCCDNFGFINFQIEAGGGAETVIEQLKQEKVHFVHVHRYHFHDYKCS